MAEAAAGDMVVAHLGDELGPSGRKSPVRPVDQRLGPPGASPVKPGAARAPRAAGQRRLIGGGNEDVKPTWWSRPASS